MIVGIILLVQWLGGRSISGAPDRGTQEEKGREERDPALEILRRRYAATGEISLEEYEKHAQIP